MISQNSTPSWVRPSYATSIPLYAHSPLLSQPLLLTMIQQQGICPSHPFKTLRIPKAQTSTLWQSPCHLSSILPSIPINPSAHHSLAHTNHRGVENLSTAAFPFRYHFVLLCNRRGQSFHQPRCWQHQWPYPISTRVNLTSWLHPCFNPLRPHALLRRTLLNRRERELEALPQPSLALGLSENPAS